MATIVGSSSTEINVVIIGETGSGINEISQIFLDENSFIILR
jgi:hypothetical protein